MYSTTGYPEPVTTVSLARLAGVPSVLPAVFYMLAVKDINMETAGHGRFESKARWELLEGKDWERLLRGKDRLRDRYGRIGRVYKAVPGPGTLIPSCNSERCERVRYACYQRYREGISLRFARSPDVLLHLRELGGRENDELCMSCNAVVEMECQKMETKLWNDLPIIFDLLPKGNDEDMGDILDGPDPDDYDSD